MSVLLKTSVYKWNKLKEVLKFSADEDGDDKLAIFLINFWEEHNCTLIEDTDYVNVPADNQEESVDEEDLINKKTVTDKRNMVEMIQKNNTKKSGHKTECNQVCCYCGNIFKNPSSLSQHEQRHEHIAPYNCSQCSKQFYSRFHMEQHNASHTGFKSFVCFSCGKRFQTKLGLQRHEKKERGDLKHKCDVCWKLFISKNDMLVHASTHVQSRLYKCSVCGTGFKHQYHLKRHMHLHKSEGKKFVCDVCDKTFPQKRYLSDHYLTHQNRLEKCFICDKNFKGKKILSVHQKKIHGHTKPKESTVRST